MTDSSKSVKVGGNRLTNLPINVIHQIQDHMSIEDAARMSVLARAWRYVWASNPNLVFDEQFCKKKTKISSTTDIIISTIVSQHHGAIKKFHAIIHSFDHSIVDDWMLLLSRNGIVDLKVDNTSNVEAPYRLPSCVYGMKLERLDLSNCIFRPPCSFKNFQRLKRLSLNRVSFDKFDVAISSLWMPNLERLMFRYCQGLHLVNIYAPELLQLMVLYCGTDFIKLGTFMDCEKLEKVIITFRNNVSQNRRDIAIKLTHLLSSWPNLRNLVLDRYALEFFAPGNEVERLPASLYRLRELRLYNFDFDSERIIFPLLFIFRSCPNLKNVIFHLFKRKKIMETDANLLEGSVWRKIQGLDNLDKLKIEGFHGSTNEFAFVKSTLISAPLLRKARLLVNNNASVDQIRSLRKELMQFPRASAKLTLKCRPLIGK